jgi:hypothetical protein
MQCFTRCQHCERKGSHLASSIKHLALKTWAVGSTAGVRFLAGARDFFSAVQCPDRLWGPLSLLSSGYLGSIPGVKAAEA